MIVRGLEEPISLGGAVRAASRCRLPCALLFGDAALCPRVMIAVDPVRVVRGDDVDELACAWAEQRAGWRAGDRPGVPAAAGFLSYDLGRRFERIRGAHLSPAPWPLVEFRFYGALLAFYPGTGRAEVWARDEPAARRLLADMRIPPEGAASEAGAARPGALTEMEPARAHLAAVARALEYIRAGDIYQVNLARRLSCALPTPPGRAPGAALFLRLQSAAPAPYAFWLADGESGTALVGNSPERFLREHVDHTVETSPIKGTRPRTTAGSARDAAALLASEKDRAEHVMIVDLERNDLGRVCRTGSVRVAELCRVLALPTVVHLESTVRGELRPEVGLPALLRATFPGGSITGAPKIRAMEIIEELEPARRGPYTGATGWLGAGGDFDLAVAIRTALVRDSRLTLWVGGGIVADSAPEAELAETWDKAEAFSRALG
ncbi:MAG: anthranilate synthase component I family protein [Deltaproteobacteria bacterium]|nr:anthranilate synthase component I family protein [Deltaproteobacteria bacterium]